ncbi:hypothetical protein [Paludibacterium sp.]|uniref:hypothetical protein n=1 Tax=Paludibacterium sp. TaxID=1917523 RepID=UPI003452EA07|nr:hypothetical protein [Paludibacterium sp.]
MAVFDQLVAEGHIAGTTGSGTCVSPSSPTAITCRHVAVAPQAVLAQFMAEGHYARHLRQMRLLYGERAAALQEACTRELDGLLALPPITTGLDAVGLLPENTDDRVMSAALAHHGIETRPLSAYCITHAAPPGLVMGFAAYDIEASRRALMAMQSILAQQHART